MNKNFGYVNKHLGSIRYRLDESKKDLNEELVQEKIESVLSSPSLRKEYFAQYKSEMLLEGKDVTEEGFGDWLKDKFTKAKDTVKGKASGLVQKVKNVAKGIADVGFLGRGTTILGGSETLDIEKRKQMIGQAEQELNSDLDALSSGLQKAGLGEFDTLKGLKSQLDGKQFPNSDSFESDVAALNAEYKKVTDGFASKKIDAKTANALIAVLRHMVIYYQDYKIHDKNLYLNEAEGDAAEAPQGLDAVKGRKQGDVSKSYQAAYGATLPLGLLAGGAALMGLGVAANSDAFQNALSGLKDMKDANVQEIVKKIKPTVVQDKITKIAKLVVKPGWGQTQALQAATGIPMGPGDSVSALFKPEAQALMGPLKKAFKTPEGVKAWDEALAFAKQNPNMSFAELFGPRGVKKLHPDFPKIIDIDPGTFADQSQQVISKTVDKEVSEAVTKTIKVPADTLKNKFLSGLGKFAGPVLSGLGLGAMVAGAASGLMRMKGKASSRMATLKKTVDTFKDVGGQEDAVVPPAEAKPGGPATPEAVPTSPEATPSSPEGEKSPEAAPTSPEETKPEEPATEPEAEKTKEPEGQLLIQPDEILSGTGEFNTQGREFVNFYQKRLPDMDPKEVEKVLASLVRSKRMISELLRKLSKLIKEAFDEPFSNKGQGAERGTYKQDMGHDKYKDSRVTGSKDRGTPYQKMGVSRFGTAKLMPGFQKLVDKIAGDSGVDKANVLKVLELVFKNEKLASDDEPGKQVVGPMDKSGDFKMPSRGEEPKAAETPSEPEDSMLTKLTQRQQSTTADDDDQWGVAAESKKTKLQESKTLNRWKKLAGI